MKHRFVGLSSKCCFRNIKLWLPLCLSDKCSFCACEEERKVAIRIAYESMIQAWAELCLLTL